MYWYFGFMVQNSFEPAYKIMFKNKETSDAEPYNERRSFLTFALQVERQIILLYLQKLFSFERNHK